MVNDTIFLFGYTIDPWHPQTHASKETTTEEKLRAQCCAEDT
jgi:hypothetical protein